jgi:hypothetical protein
MLDVGQSTFQDFSLKTWLGARTDLARIWRALVRNTGILIVGNSPETVSNAVFAVISIIGPLIYREPFLVYTRLGDPRFSEVVDGSTHWKIVGTTNFLALQRCKQFSVVIKLPDIAKLVNDETERGLFVRKTSKLLESCQRAINRRIKRDPYVELLGEPMVGQESEKSDLKDENAVTRVLFYSTLTFAGWRRGLVLRDEYRSGFLSISPEKIVVGRSYETLVRMEACLCELDKMFVNDEHLLAVLRRHLHLVRKEKRKTGPRE